MKPVSLWPWLIIFVHLKFGVTCPLISILVFHVLTNSKSLVWTSSSGSDPMHADTQRHPSSWANSVWLRLTVGRFKSPVEGPSLSQLWLWAFCLWWALFYPGSEDGSLCFPCPPSHSRISPHWLKVSPTTVPVRCEAGSRLASRRRETYSALLLLLAGCSLAVSFYLILSDIWSKYFIICLMWSRW